MKITGFDSIKNSGAFRKTGKSGATASFADVLALSESGEATQAVPVGDVAATTALDNLLALQEISEEEIQRRKLAQQGKNMLDILEELRRRLLTGTLPMHVIQDLSRHVSMQKQIVSDPRLTAIIEEIEIRAAVELAKLEMAVSKTPSPLQE